MQLISATLLFSISMVIEDVMQEKELPIMFLSVMFFCLVLLAATQDIAVDGNSLSLSLSLSLSRTQCITNIQGGH